MGATTFESYGLGKTPQEAFRQAVENAHWEHGHAGYSGSIAEKPGFVLFSIPKGIRCSASKFVELVSAAAYAGAGEDAGDSYLKDSLRWAKTATERRKIEAQIRKEERQEKAFWKKVNPKLVPVVVKAAPVYDSKWDACVAVEVTGREAVEIKDRHGRKGTHDKVFLFAGYASC